MRKVDKIIVHCSATPEDRAVTVKEIDSWHKAQGYRSIGYHYVVYLDGSIHPGRPESLAGAHCKGQNENSIGVCYVGGVAADGKTPKDTRTEAQKKALIDLLKRLKSSYPGATIHGHNEFAAKACPSFNAKEEYSSL